MSTDLKLGIDAKAGEAGARKFVGALNSIRAALNGLEKDAAGAYLALQKGMKETPRGAEQALKGTAKAASATEAAMQRLATAAKNTLTTAGAQTAKLRADFEALGSTAGVDRAAQAYARLQAAASKASNSTQLGAAKADFRSTITGLQQESRAMQQAAKEAAAYEARTEALLKKHYELYAASQQAVKGTAEINELMERGAISNERAAVALARVNDQLADGTLKVGKFGQGLKINAINNFNHAIHDVQGTARRFDLRGMSMQISQVVQSAQAGTDPLRAFFLQIPDMAMYLGGPLTIAAASAAGALGTILVGALSKTKEETETTKEKLKSLSDVLDALEGNSRASASQIEAHLKRAFGSVAGDVQALIEDLREADFAVLSHKMQRQIETATSELTRLGGAFEVYWTEFMNPGSFDSGYLRQTQELIAKSGIAYGEFQRLEGALKAVFTAKDTDTFIASLAQARTIAADIGGPIGKQIEAALMKAAEEGGVLNRVTADAASETTKAASSAGGLSQNIGTAANEAARLLQNLGNIPSAVGLLNKSIDDQIAEVSAQNESLGLQLSSGLEAAAANRRVQLNDMLKAGALTPDQMVKELAHVDQLNAALKTQEDLRKKLTETNKTVTGSGRGTTSKGMLGDIARTTQSIKEQTYAYEALAAGTVKTEEAARLLGRAMVEGGGQVSENTLALIRNADAAQQAQDRLEKIVRTHKDGNFAGDVEGAFKSGLKRGLSDIGQGDFAGFVTSLRDSVTGAIIDGIAEGFVDSMFKKQAGNAAGNIFTTALGWFGFGSEGGYSTDLPQKGLMPLSAFANAPQYAEGTANTSNAIPAVLHPNEAVVPLTRGRRIPIDMGKGAGGSVVNNNNVTVNVEGGDQTDAELATTIARKMEETLNGIVDTRMAQGMRYGGVMNPRGGRG